MKTQIAVRPGDHQACEGSFRRFSFRGSLHACALTGLLACAAAARAASPGPLEAQIQLDIPADTPLDEALLKWSTVSGIQVMMSADVVGQERANAFHGRSSAEAALSKLLQGSGLKYTVIDDTVRVTPEARVVRSANRSESTHDDNNPNPPSSASSDTEKSGVLEEIVVSAQKQEERLLDVPVPVTAVAAATLTDRGAVHLQDYFSSIPGLTLTTGDEQGFSQLAIRGLTTGGFSTPTVGVVLDDVPLGSTVGIWSFEAPELDPSDLERVEVLRGPQGTLYGASSMGGLLKYVTLSPNTDSASARIQVGGDTVYNSEKPGYNIRASGNLPLGDTLAVRASAFHRYDAGYIDNVRDGARGVNSEEVNGGRAAVLWRPMESLTINLSALSQHGRVNGSPDVDAIPGLGDLQQNKIPGTGWRENSAQVYSAKVDAKILGADVTSITAHNVNKLADLYDFTQTYGSAMETLTGINGIGAAINVTDRTSKFTQELRISLPLGNRVKLLLGGYYGRETEGWYEPVLALNPTTGAPVLNAGAYSGAGPTGPGLERFSERAVFANVTVNVTDRLDVQLGGRQSYNDRLGGGIEAAGDIGTLFFGADPYIRPDQRTKDHPATYLFTPRFKFSPDLMVYARFASGYRPGGPSLLGAPVKPDTTQNYELGAKGTALNQTLIFDASLYYIDWKNIPFEVREPVSNLLGLENAARAKSQGIELSTEWHPIGGLKILGWATWNDAQITEVSPTSTLLIQVGDRLPLNSRFSGNLSVNQAFGLPAGFTGFVEGSASYVGDRKSVFVSAGPRQDFPQYTTLALRSGLTRDPWEIALYANNLTNRRGVLSGGIGTLNPQSFYYIQPRTVGATLSRTF